jgi:type II secretory pathway component PulF
MKQLSYGTLSFIFYQLASLTEAGIPIIDAWKLLLRDIGNQKQRQILNWAIHQMEKGMAPSQAMERAHLFPRLVCTVMIAGEHAGNLDGMFTLLGDYYENAGKQQRVLIEELSYPAFLLACIITLFVGAAFFILPVFEEMFQQMNVPLPMATQCLLQSVRVMADHAAMIGLISCIGAGLIGWAWKNTTISSLCLQHLLSYRRVRMVCVMWCWQRFSRILSVQLTCGMPLLQALHDASVVVPLQAFRLYVFRVTHAVENGLPLSKAIHGGLWSTTYIETMLIVGETTGKYDEALATIAAYYDWRLGSYLAGIQQFLGPVILIIIGAIMGMVIICLILPLMDMATGIAI